MENRFAGQFSNDHCRRSGVRLAGSGKCVEMRVGRWNAFSDRLHASGDAKKQSVLRDLTIKVDRLVHEQVKNEKENKRNADFISYWRTDRRDSISSPRTAGIRR